MEAFLLNRRKGGMAIIVARVDNRVIREGKNFRFDRLEHERPGATGQVRPAYAPDE